MSNETTSITLPTAPPYDWGRTYAAADAMAFHLPGVPLSPSNLVRPTEDGFDVLSSDAEATLARVVVGRKHERPLKPGDPIIVSDVPGVVEAVLGEALPGDQWLVRSKAIGSERREETVPSSCIAFSWDAGRDMWIKATSLAPHLAASRSTDWLGVASLEPEDPAVLADKRALAAGDPAALIERGVGVTLLQK